MAEYIERKTAIANSREYNLGGSYDNTERAVPVDAINSIPAAEVRPVVLCRDCDMYECHEYDGRLKYVCRLFKRQMQEADFCSYGEKR